MKCTRCNKKLIEAKNIPFNWHIPICTACRNKLLKDLNFKLTKQELNTMEKRFKDEKKRN